MKHPAAFVLILGAALAACTPYPAPVAQAPLTPEQQHECAMIRGEIARQQRIAQLSPIMETLMVEGSVRLSAANVITGLEQRAAIEGCPIVYGWNGRHRRADTQYKA